MGKIEIVEKGLYFTYKVTVSWENRDGDTDFDHIFVKAQNVEEAKDQAIADAGSGHSGRIDFEVEAVYVRVE